MTANPVMDLKLPILRRDLQVFAGPADLDGTPSFTFFDPLSGRYTKIGWAEATVLRYLRAGMTVGDLVRKVHSETTLRINAQEVIDLCESAERSQLFAGTSARKAERFREQYAARQRGPLQWLLAHYLFFRIPLLRPDAFLTRTVDSMRGLASRAAFVLYALVGAMGLYLVLGRLDTYLTTFGDLLNWRGLVTYGLAITAVKAVHEFSHAYTAKSFGASVRSMGVAFMVFWPIPYCDVTDAWRLASRRQRFLIGIAGVASELAIAGLSLFLWALMPGGVLKYVFFVLSSVTIASTVLINLNPAMRFDGYYLLMDLSGVDNLRPRAFAVAKWRLRSWLLGLRLPPPESNLTFRRQAWMMVYSIYTWIYRFFLYLGIAILVYHKFTKAVGLILFAAEIWLFLAQPVIREVQELGRLRHALRFNRRLLVTLLVLVLLFAWLCLPLPRRLAITAVTVPERSQTVYVREPGLVQTLAAKRGDRVEKGELLLRVHPRRLDTDIQLLTTEATLLAEEIDRMAVDEELSGYMRQKREALAKTKAQLQGLRERRAQSELRATLSGTICEWDESVRQGESVRRGMALGVITDLARMKLVAYLSEDYLGAVTAQDPVRFVANGTLRTYTGRIRSISPIEVHEIDHPALITRNGGDVSVRSNAQGRLVPYGSFYEMEVDLDSGGAALQPGQAGFLELRTRPRSRLVDTARYLWGLILQESGF